MMLRLAFVIRAPASFYRDIKVLTDRRTFFGLAGAALLPGAALNTVSASKPSVPDARIPIVAYSDSTVVGPIIHPDWQTADPFFQATAPRARELERCQRIAQFALAVYPYAKLSMYLDRVIVCEQIFIYHTEVCGTSINRYIFASSTPSGCPPLTEFDFRRVVHAELSDILFRVVTDKRFTERWMRHLPPHTGYGDGAMQAAKEYRAGLDPDFKYLQDGFFCEYSKSAIEKDVSTLVHMTLNSPNDAWAWCRAFPRIRAKVELVIEMYSRAFGADSPCVTRMSRCLDSGK